MKHMLHKYGHEYIIVRFDNLEYCASLENFTTIQRMKNFHFVEGDICNSQDVASTLGKYEVDAIVHLAARSHVDESFNDPLSFTKTNVFGTQILLEACRKMGNIKRFTHVSTDEVYGENDTSEMFSLSEDDAMNPTNPYSASKAAAEMIVKGYQKSFQLPIVVTGCNNVFSPDQYPESMSALF